MSTAAAPADVARDLYERHARTVYSLCLRRLGSREEAEDAAQTVFLNAFGALQRGSRPRFESAWLRRIAENVCHDRRARRHDTRDLQAFEEVLASPERDHGALDGIEQALAGLPASQRRAILLREWQGLSYREIGVQLGLSETAAEALAFRARRTLAERLRGSRANLPLLGWLKPAAGGSAVATNVLAVAGVLAVGAGGVTAGYAVSRPEPSQAPLVRIEAPAGGAPISDAFEKAFPTARARAKTQAAAATPRVAEKREAGTQAPGEPRPAEGTQAIQPPATSGSEPAPTRDAGEAPTGEAKPAVDAPEILPVEAPALPKLPDLPEVPQLPVDPPPLPPVDAPTLPPVEAPSLPPLEAPVTVPTVPSVEPPALPGL